MSSLDWDESVFLPDEEACFEYLREQQWSEEPICPSYYGTELLRKGTTSKGAQQYYCYGCERRFNALTETIFAEHRMSIAEMFYIIRKMKHESTAEISRSLDRTYKTVLEFVHEVQEAVHDGDFELAGVCEADEVSVVVGEKGRDQDDPRERGLSKRDAERSPETNHQS